MTLEQTTTKYGGVRPTSIITEIPLPLKQAEFVPKSKITKEYEKSRDLVFAHSLSEKQPLAINHIKKFLTAGKDQTAEFIDNNGPYENVENGKHAQGWIETFNRAIDVLEGERNNPLSIHKIINSICEIRKSQAEKTLKRAQKNLSVDFDKDRKSILVETATDIEIETNKARAILENVIKGNKAVLSFVEENWPIDQ